MAQLECELCSCDLFPEIIGGQVRGEEEESIHGKDPIQATVPQTQTI